MFIPVDQVDRFVVIVIIVVLMMIDDVVIGFDGLKKGSNAVISGNEYFGNVSAAEAEIAKYINAKRKQLLVCFIPG